MSDLQKIKNRIFEEEKIEHVLELLGCGSINEEQGGNLFTSSLPDGSNKRSVQIRNNKSLNSAIRSRNVDGDIYDIVSYIKFEAESESELRENLPRSKQWLCDKLGYMEYVDDFYKEVYGIEDTSKVNYNSWLSKVKSRKNSLGESHNEVIDESQLQRYGLIPNHGWLFEGISYETQIEYGVGIDVQSERITFPVHNKNGELIGVKGRYIGKDKIIEDSYKYLYLLPCNKSIEMFNYHRAIEHIRETKEVFIVEGAKTVMLLHTWGMCNVLSIEGDSLSNYQVKILRELGLDIKFIFALDKDKDVEYVKRESDKLQGRQRYAVIDVENLLNKKDSPTDKGKPVWRRLLEIGRAHV